MSDICLHLSQDAGKNILSIRTENEIRQNAASAGASYRASPIFPVYPAIGKLPSPGEEYFVGFFCCDNPFSILGRLYGELDPKKQAGLWFSHGLASLIIFARAPDEINNIRKAHETELRAVEVWHVVCGEVFQGEIWFHSPAPASPNMPKLGRYALLPPDQVLIIDLLSKALDVAIHGSAQYFPRNLETLNRLVPSVNDLLSEMQFLFNPELSPPSAFSQDAALELRSDPTQLQKLIHQRTGDLVQIAASLNAANIQAFSGAFPLLPSSVSSIGTHSLLGIGTAFKALASFSEFVERIFQKYPIASVIRDCFDAPPPVEIFPYLINYNPTSWGADKVKQVDHYLKGCLAPNDCKFNIVYYSLRIGFRESNFSTTAALPAIAFCDDARWSLMTLSHEILHAHVSEVLAAIFYDNDHDLPAESFRRYKEKFAEDVNGEPREPRHLIDSLRSMILNYQSAHPQFTSLAENTSSHRQTGQTEGDVEIELVLPPEETLLDPLNTVFHEINEIMVHVLDFNYFYECNEEMYLGLLWESWSPVPKVLQDIEHYVFRSLVAIASGTDKTALTLTTRFDKAVETLKSVLETLLGKTTASHAVLREALKCLADPASLEGLLQHFHLGAYLADVTREFLCSRHIHGALYEDDNCTKRDGVYYYSLDTGEFRDITVTSPVALVADRLRAALVGELRSLSSQHRAAWLLLACASVGAPEGV